MPLLSGEEMKKKKTAPRASTASSRNKSGTASSADSSKRKQNMPTKRASVTKVIVARKRFAIHTKILSNINYLQRTTHNLIPKLPFSRLVREVCMQYGATNLRIQSVALEALQAAAEMFLVEFFEDSYICALHAGRVTLFVRDMLLTKQIRKDF